MKEMVRTGAGHRSLGVSSICCKLLSKDSNRRGTMTQRNKRLYCFILLLLWVLVSMPMGDSIAASVTLAKGDAGAEKQQQVPAGADEAVGAGVVVSAEGAPLGSTKHGEEFKGLMMKWLHSLDAEQSAGDAGSSILAYGQEVPGDLTRAFDSIGQQKKGPGFWGVLSRSIVAIGIGGAVMFIFSRTARRRISQLQKLTPPESDGWASFWTGVLRNMPAMVNLLVLAIVSIAIFLLMAGNIGVGGRMLFQALLGTVLIVQLCRVVSEIIFSPDAPEIRLFPINDTLIRPLYRAFFLSFAALLAGLLIVKLILGLGAKPQTLAWVRIVLGTSVVSVFGYLVIFLKKPVSEVFLSDIKKKGGSWLKEQFAVFWHLPALFYLLCAWATWLGQELSGTFTGNGSFIISMLIVPMYFVMSFAGKSMIASVVDSLGLAGSPDDEQQEAGELDSAELVTEKRLTIIRQAHQVFNVVLATILATWVLSLWGVQIPYAAHAVKALFESLVVVALALVGWRFASGYIERKLAEATPEAEEKEADVDDEFGGAVARGRSHTLLPMVRKVLGTVLMVMVALIIISSLGVNIGPLLAGAGVLGLAVGFGAQKLVSDVLSGFFFLLDDAFRVGEYIQTGSIRGTVESITLRNVMLRHHLGMLQIVPHSDLGAVTNYMRGGIVIKFPLEFPYDTDIDKVRKIIKKVGQAMLTDEEVGEDFILPIKSQGVHQITNSVMVIRVKFTAKPGKQFVIKREAFRRITEALNAKGIYYAHRKVIVDISGESHHRAVDEEANRKMIEAGAGAALVVAAEEEAAAKKAAEEKR